jgi:hypothetical protein
MPAPSPRPAFHQWRDVEGIPIPLLCRVAQIAVRPEHGAMPSRLHQHGQVIGRDTTWLHVCFDDHRLVILRPHRVHVLDPTPGGN